MKRCPFSFFQSNFHETNSQVVCQTRPEAIFCWIHPGRSFAFYLLIRFVEIWSKNHRRGIQMDPLPPYVDTWVLKRNGERHYLCRLRGGVNDDHGDEAAFRQHLRSPIHLVKIRRMESLHCTVCDMQFRFPSLFRNHTLSKSHQQKVNPQPKPVSEFKCEPCGVVFSNQKDYARHLDTRKHMRKINPPSEKPYFCKECSVDCKFPYRMAQHIATQKHLKAIAKTDSNGSCPVSRIENASEHHRRFWPQGPAQQ